MTRTIHPRRGTPVTGPDGIQYRSCGEAARALGYHVSTIRHHWVTYGHLGLLGSGKTPCEHKGKRYESMEACASALGLKRHTLSHHLEVHGNLDRAGIGKRKGNPGNRGRRLVTRIGPLEWPRRKDAAADLGISSTTLSRWLSPHASKRQRERLIAEAMHLGAGIRATRDNATGGEA